RLGAGLRGRGQHVVDIEGDQRRAAVERYTSVCEDLVEVDVQATRPGLEVNRAAAAVSAEPELILRIQLRRVGRKRHLQRLVNRCVIRVVDLGNADKHARKHAGGRQ